MMKTHILIYVLIMLIPLTMAVSVERLLQLKPTKPQVGVAAIGASGHGKTTLTAAITRVLGKIYGGKAYPVEQIEGLEESDILFKGLIHAAEVYYETATREYTQIDCPTNTDYMKGMIAGIIPMDGAILVVSATDGIVEETRKQVRLCQKIGVPSVLVFLNKCDLVDHEELLDLVEAEIRALLSYYGFPGDDIPIIRGSALMVLQDDEASSKQILRLTETMDEYIPQPERAIDKPLLMPIENVFSITGRGTVATGRIESGVIRAGDEVEIVGIRPTVKTTCTGVEMFRKLLDAGFPGDNVGLLLRGIKLEDVQRGQVVAKPGSIQSHIRFESEVYIWREKQSAYLTLLINSHQPLEFYFRNTGITGIIKLPDGVERVNDDDTNTIVVELVGSIAMNEGLRFEIRSRSSTIGVGVVTKIIE